ncbi:Sua5/YciO/YrdC/YwlC family protein [Escherichia coli]
MMAPLALTKSAMSPVNPLQHLLLQELQCPLVMTSGNLSGKPPAISNEQALADFVGHCRRFLIHNRDIVQRTDDSGGAQSGEMLRRSRGMYRLPRLCLRALKMCRLCCVSAQI